MANETVGAARVWSVKGRSPYTLAIAWRGYAVANTRAGALAVVNRWVEEREREGARVDVTFARAGSLDAVTDVKPVRSLPEDAFLLAPVLGP